MTSAHPKLSQVIADIEQSFSAIYGFKCETSATDFMIDDERLEHTLAQEEQAKLVSSSRANLIIVEEPDNEYFMGIHIHPQIINNITENYVEHGISHNNLDAFCVLVEELSHFHLILNKTHKGSQVSRLELELQGEVDKVAVTAHMLQNLKGDAHLLPLARRIYDQSYAMAPQQWAESYDDAHRLAAQFWFRLIDYCQSININNPKHALIGEYLRDFYHANLSQKIRAVEDLAMHRAA
jgi:hypothetical protein